MEYLISETKDGPRHICIWMDLDQHQAVDVSFTTAQ
jgi:hypothetical protein